MDVENYLVGLENLPQEHEAPAKNDLFERLLRYTEQASGDWRQLGNLKVSEYDADSRARREENWAIAMTEKLKKSNSLAAFSGKLRQVHENPNAVPTDYRDSRHLFPYRESPEEETLEIDEISNEADLDDIESGKGSEKSPLEGIDEDQIDDIFEQADLDVDEFQERTSEAFETVVRYTVPPVVERYRETA
jgi:hypothetical protein|nr:MAG: hypothetical protein J07AB56_13130 [Candidatus Nanosalinarum sp. J07AB56]